MEPKKLSEKKRFSIISRIKSTNDAWRGFIVFAKTTHNFWVQIFLSALAVYLGLILKISYIEWAIIVFAIGLVVTTEIINTAFEIDIDLTSPTYHPYARDIKDVAAGAVLFADFIASIIALIIFLPKIIEIF